MVGTELKLQEAKEKREEYFQKLKDLANLEDKRLEERETKLREEKRKRVLQTILKAAKEPEKQAKAQQELVIRHMKEKQEKVSKEIAAYNKQKNREKGSDLREQSK